MGERETAIRRAAIDAMKPERAGIGKSSARFWRFGGSNFYVGVLRRKPIILDHGAHDLFPKLPKGASLLAITTNGRRWKIYSTNPDDTKWLKIVGLHGTVFPTRREALWHLREAMKARFG